jgi:predicted nucleotidyltransferase component of viral defense system
VASSRLTALQAEILQAFFRREQGFFLTGGAALAGFHLGHRETHDLDLFTLTGPLTGGVDAVRDLAREIGARCEETRTAPEFRRFVLSRGDESVVVDLVVERAPQLVADKPKVGAIRLDPAEEILANKLCALLGRAEIRDLVDVRALEESGLSLQRALEVAQMKDGGLTPAQLAWVLSQISIGDEARVPGGRAGADLRRYLGELIDRLVALARP